MICAYGKAEVSTVCLFANKLTDNAARRATGGSLMCRPLHGIQIHTVLVHLPKRGEFAQFADFFL